MKPHVFALVGCSKQKQTSNDPMEFFPAGELYQSQLFRARVDHVTRRGIPYFILSAKAGLIRPETRIRTYDKTLRDCEQIDFAAWHVGTALNLIDELYHEYNIRDLRTVRIEIHAGEQYAEPLATILHKAGLFVGRPLQGVGIGKQLRYYAQFEFQPVKKGGEA